MQNDFYGPKTIDLIKSGRIEPRRIYRMIPYSVRAKLREWKNFDQFRLLRNAMLRFDFVLPVIKEDYDLLFETGLIKGEYLSHSYSGIEQRLKSSLNLQASGDNILIGNSATFTNNHLEIIERLGRVTLGERKIYFPLSYGNQKYSAYIKEEARRNLGESRCVFLDEFLHVEKYFQIVSSCGFVLMNHFRQQAAGNVSAMLYYGARVFLSSRSPLYRRYKDSGYYLVAP